MYYFNGLFCCNCKLRNLLLCKRLFFFTLDLNVLVKVKSAKSQTKHSAPHDYLFLSFYQAATSPHSQISCVQTPNSPYELFCCLSMAVTLYKSQLHLVSVHKQRETSPDCLIATDLLSTDVWFKVYAVKILSLIISALVTHITLFLIHHKLLQATNAGLRWLVISQALIQVTHLQCFVTLYFKVSLYQCNYAKRYWVILFNSMYLQYIYLGFGLGLVVLFLHVMFNR